MKEKLHTQTKPERACRLDNAYPCPGAGSASRAAFSPQPKQQGRLTQTAPPASPGGREQFRRTGEQRSDPLDVQRLQKWGKRPE